MSSVECPRQVRRALIRKAAILLGVPALCGVAFWIGTAAHMVGKHPPKPDPFVTAIIQETAPSTNVTVQGMLTRRNAVTVSWGAGEEGVITGLPLPVDAQAKSGDAVAEVNGRPVLVLTGSLPAYRDLLPGAVGPDVIQLTTALTALGYMTGLSDTYTPEVAAAVRAMYANAGYAAPGTSAELGAQLEAARQEIRNLDASAVVQGSTLDRQVARDRALRAISLAEQRAADLSGSRERTRAELQAAVEQTEPGSTAALTALQQIAAFDAQGASAIREAEEAVLAAREDLVLAEAALTNESGTASYIEQMRIGSQERLEEATVLADTPLPSSEIVFAPLEADKVTGLYVRVGDVVQGDILTVGEGSLIATLEWTAGLPPPVVGDMTLVTGAQGQIVRDVPIVSVAEQSKGRWVFDVAVPASVGLAEDEAVVVTLSVTQADQPVVETVPRSSLVAETDGRLYLDVIEADEIRRVEVKQVAATTGTVSIESVDGASLAGDRVVVHLGSASG